MFGAFAHVSRTRGYRCKRCDVYGRGDRCWSCGSKRKLDVPTFVPSAPGGSHHYDLHTRDVHMAGAIVEIDDYEGVAI